MVSTDHMPTETSSFRGSHLASKVETDFDRILTQIESSIQLAMKRDVSVTMVSFIMCRVIECRLQIAIGRTDPKSTVYNSIDFICQEASTDS